MAADTKAVFSATVEINLRMAPGSSWQLLKTQDFDQPTSGHISPQSLKEIKGRTLFMCTVGDEQWAVNITFCHGSVQWQLFPAPAH